MRALRVIVFDSEVGSTREERYERSPVRLGRNPNNELFLSFGFVSGWHAQVDFDARGGAFRDKGSTNGSLVEGRRLEKDDPVSFRDGSLTVNIGRLEIRFVLEEVVRSQAPAPERVAKVDRAPGIEPAPLQEQLHPALGGSGAPTKRPPQPTVPIQAASVQEPLPRAPTGPHQSLLGGAPSLPGRMDPAMQGPPLLDGPPPIMNQGPPPIMNQGGPPLLNQGPPPIMNQGGVPSSKQSGRLPVMHPSGQPASAVGGPSDGPPPLPFGSDGPKPSLDPSPQAAPKKSGAEATGFMDLSGVHRAMRALRPAYEAFSTARKLFQDQVDAELEKLPANSRDTALAFFRREFPDMPGATPFAAPTSPPAGAPESSEAVEQFAQALLSNVAAPSNADEAVAFLARVAEIMQTSAQAFVEIRNVQARFGDEMGVRTIREYTPLHGAPDARNVLDYLLDWRRGGPERNAQLAAVYSDFMLHQVAMINGVVEGVQALLEQFRPQEIERGVSGLNKSAAIWKKYGERYLEMIEERGVSQLVFGPEFARAYAQVGGGG